MPPAVTNILQEFADVFPQDVPPGLPPIRGIERQIDLIPGASLPNRAPYRTNLEETKEIMRQFDRGKGVPSFDEMMDIALVEVDFDDPTTNVR